MICHFGTSTGFLILSQGIQHPDREELLGRDSSGLREEDARGPERAFVLVHGQAAGVHKVSEV